MTDIADLTVAVRNLNDADLAAVVAAGTAEQARRAAALDRARRAAAYRIAASGPDDPRWTPHMWDGARLAAGPAVGLKGFIAGRCEDGCEQVDGEPRWTLYGVGGGPLWTCVPREHLRPVPTVRRPGGQGRARCDYSCLCCMGDPRQHLAEAARA
ncbi:hypothetical protein E1211_17875 [Micromonospora sp. 15K316]|uniref:hypothetical protein n=1 Tax=Micromonospora sp. 15K316 TaxID=2530376 RepID=UPI0010538B2E|nr:hypothetical protein [Micromonospora sp. 15K316]TDC34216.1 hypothetical protein E1211_17875 [Micromonospora sp. 15K316]